MAKKSVAAGEPLNRRQPRPGTISSAQKRSDAMRALWEQLKGDRPKNEPIDGRKMAADADQLFRMTGDPVFKLVREVLQAYRLDGGEPKRSMRRFWELNDARWYLAPLQVETLIKAAEDKGASLTVSAACRETVAKFGLAANSFEAAVKMLRDRVRDVKKNGYPELNRGKTGRRLFILPLDPETRERLPDEGAEVADDTYWRQKFYSGKVAAQVLVANRPPKKDKT